MMILKIRDTWCLYWIGPMSRVHIFYVFYLFIVHHGDKYLSIMIFMVSLLNIILVSGTNLMERFRDQFSALLIGQNMPWSVSDSTIIRLPLSSEYMEEGIESASKKISLLFNKFMEHASRTILFLNSIMQVFWSYSASLLYLFKWKEYFFILFSNFFRPSFFFPFPAYKALELSDINIQLRKIWIHKSLIFLLWDNHINLPWGYDTIRQLSLGFKNYTWVP